MFEQENNVLFTDENADQIDQVRKCDGDKFDEIKQSLETGRDASQRVLMQDQPDQNKLAEMMSDEMQYQPSAERKDDNRQGTGEDDD